MPDQSRENFVGDRTSQMLALRDALASGNAKTISSAFAMVARSRGLAAMALQARMSAADLHRALADSEHPDIPTLARIVAALSEVGPQGLADKQ